jgi:hypothetical protein
MILIGPDEEVGAGPDLAIRVPMLPLRETDLLAAQTLLLPHAGDAGVLAQLRAEMGILPGRPDPMAPTGFDVASRAARAVERGWLDLAVEVPDDIEVFFAASQPIGDSRDSVVFPPLELTAAFVAALRLKPANDAAFAAAIAHSAGTRHLAAVKTNFVPGKPDDASARVPQMLVSRKLVLRAASPTRRRFQLLWVVLAVPGAAAAAPAPARTPRPAPAPAPAPAPSTLPDAPEDLIAQALALLAAAQNGTPFCDECVPGEPPPSAQAQALRDAAQEGAAFCEECAAAEQSQSDQSEDQGG